MEAITDSDGDRDIFAVDRDEDELWLNGSISNPSYFWNAGSRFVFLRRKPA